MLFNNNNNKKSTKTQHHFQNKFPITFKVLMFQVSHPCVCLLVQRPTHFSDMILRVICTTQLPYRFLLLVQGLNSPCSYSVHVQIKSHRLEMSYWSWIYFPHQKAESAVSAPLLPQEMAHMHEEWNRSKIKTPTGKKRTDLCLNQMWWIHNHRHSKSAKWKKDYCFEWT